MLDMLFLIFIIYQYVINEKNNKLIQMQTQHTIHQAHKCSWSIGQTKWNYNKLIMPMFGLESCLVNFLLFDPYLVLFGSQVNLREHCFSLQLIKQLINPQQWIPILNGHFVQFPVFNA